MFRGVDLGNFCNLSTGDGGKKRIPSYGRWAGNLGHLNNGDGKKKTWITNCGGVNLGNLDNLSNLSQNGGGKNKFQIMPGVCLGNLSNSGNLSNNAEKSKLWGIGFGNLTT